MKFHVDLGVGYEVREPLESVKGEGWLGFAAIPAVMVPALSVEQPWAEDGAQLGAEYLERDLAMVADIVREVDGGHPARAEFALDAVAVGEAAVRAALAGFIARRRAPSRRRPGSDGDSE